MRSLCRIHHHAAPLLALLALGCLGPSSGPAICPESPAPQEHSAPAGLVPGDAGRGASLFAANCARCHSPDIADRESRVFRRYPRLDCSEWLAGASDAYLYRIIAGGGVPFGKEERMKPFADQLSAAEISDLVAYLRSLGR